MTKWGARVAGAMVLASALVPVSGRAQADDKAQQILVLTNQDRAGHGLPPLRWSNALAAAAAAHDDRMTQSRDLSHQYPGEPDVAARAAQAGAHFRAVAENIATGPTPEAIEREWMHSTAHRTNILDPQMNALGVAVVERSGELYAVEDFANASEAMTPEQVEQRVSELLRAQNIDPSGPAAEAEAACRSGRGIPQGSAAKSVVRFETGDLGQLPSQVVDALRSGGFTKAAVGACTPSNAQPNFTTYRVAVLLY